MGGNAIGSITIQRDIAITRIDVFGQSAQIQLFVPRPILYTSDLPGFAPRLLAVLPALRCTVCHNDNGLAFSDELYATEMGHVVEHVVLALLTRKGIYAKGVTEWNWFQEPEGTFVITLVGSGLEPASLEMVVGEALTLLDGVLDRKGTCSREGALLY